MIKNNIYENLDGYQLAILEKALEGKTIEESNRREVYSKVQELEYEAHREWGGISSEAQDNFNEVYRYLNSQEGEDIRKEELIKFINNEYIDIQKNIDGYIEQSKEDILPEEILSYGINTEDSMWKSAGVSFGFSDKEMNRIIKCKELDFHGYDYNVNILDLVKVDNERIENRSKLNKAYDLLNKLYNAVPKSYRDKIGYGTDYADNGDEKAGETIFFDNIAIGTIDDINNIGCIDGEICGREENEISVFDKYINIDCIESYRNIFFTYKGNGNYKCEMTPSLEKGKIHSKEVEMITV